MRATVFTPAAEPAPAAVGQLHLDQRGHPFAHHLVERFTLENRVAFESLPLLRALAVVADLLRIQIGAFVPDLLQIEVHLDQDLLRDHRGQEAVECLLGAAVGIVGQERQRIDHRAGQRGRIAHFQATLLHTTLRRHCDAHARARLVGAYGSRPRVHLEQPVDEARDFDFHGIRFFIGERLHPHHRQPFPADTHAPIDAPLAIGRHHDLHRRLVQRLDLFAGQFQHGRHGLVRGQIVVDVGRQDGFILLHQESRRL